MITIYCSEDPNKLREVYSGQDYLIPYPEEGKHPKVMQEYLTSLLENIHYDITILTLSRDVINVTINYVEAHTDLDERDCVVTFLGEDGSINPSYLCEDYCLTDWQIGCMSIN